MKRDKRLWFRAEGVVESPAPPLLGSAYAHQNSAQTPQYSRNTSASTSLPSERLAQRLFSIINLAGPPLMPLQAPYLPVSPDSHHTPYITPYVTTVIAITIAP